MTDDEVDEWTEFDGQLLVAHEICAPDLLDDSRFRRYIIAFFPKALLDHLRSTREASLIMPRGVLRGFFRRGVRVGCIVARLHRGFMREAGSFALCMVREITGSDGLTYLGRNAVHGCLGAMRQPKRALRRQHLRHGWGRNVYRERLAEFGLRRMHGEVAGIVEPDALLARDELGHVHVPIPRRAVVVNEFEISLAALIKA